MYRWLGRHIVRHRAWILPLVLAIAAGCAWVVPQLQFNFSPQQFFNTESDLGETRDEFAETFTREDNLVALAVSGEDVFEPEVLGAIRNATLEIREIDGVHRAESIATFGIPRAGDSPGSIDVDPLLQQEIRRDDGSTLPVEPARAEKLRDLAMDEPLVRGRLVSDDADAAAIFAWLEEDVQQVSRLKELTGAIQERLDRNPLPDEYAYRSGGVPVLRGKIVDALQAEQIFFLPITGLVYLFILAFMFRRPAGVLLPIGVVLMAVAATIAVMVGTSSAINVVNNVLPSVIFIIGIADSIHLLTRQAEEVDAGHDRKSATARMVATTGFACLMTSTTTAIGFLSLLYADTAILQNFGWQAAAGVMTAYFFSLFFLPAALSYLRPVQRESSPEARETQPPVERGLLGAARRVLDHPWKAVAGSLAVCALFGWFATSVEINTKILEVFHRDHPSYQTTQFMEDNFGGFLPIEVSLESDREGRFKDPEIYRKLRAFQKDAAREEPVLSTQSIADFHQSARAALLGDPDARKEMPEKRSEIQQLHLLVAGSPDDPTGPNQYVTRDFSRARVLLRVGDVGAKRQIALAESLREQFDEHFGDVDDIDYRITGDAYAASVALKSFIVDLFYSLLFAGAIIFAILTLMFRSIRIGLVSIVPNATPLLITFGYMGIRGIDLNSSTVIIFAIGLGLAVDDTIHVLARFQEERLDTDSMRDAVLRTYFGAGRAILLTSLLLVLGLVVLLFSDFIPTRRFGELTCVTIGAAIVGDLILLPPLLYLVFGSDDDGPRRPDDD